MKKVFIVASRYEGAFYASVCATYGKGAIMETDLMQDVMHTIVAARRYCRTKGYEITNEWINESERNNRS